MESELEVNKATLSIEDFKKTIEFLNGAQELADKMGLSYEDMLVLLKQWKAKREAAVAVDKGIEVLVDGEWVVPDRINDQRVKQGWLGFRYQKENRVALKGEWRTKNA